MSNTALTAISIAVGICFVFFGTLKLAPVFSEDLYRSMRKMFVQIYSPFPLSQWTGWNPSPHDVRRVYGSLEVVGGIMMVACSGLMQDVSSGTLLVLMLFNLLGIWNASGDPKDASNSIVFGLLLTCRFVIRAQLIQNSRELSVTQCDEVLKEDIRRRVAALRDELDEMQKSLVERTQSDDSTESNPVKKRSPKKVASLQKSE